MGISNKDLADKLMMGLAYSMLFISLSPFITKLSNYTIFFVVAGIFLLVFRKWLAKKVRQSENLRNITEDAVEVAGFIILFIGVEMLLNVYTERFGWIFVIIGIFLYKYYPELTNSVFRNT